MCWQSWGVGFATAGRRRDSLFTSFTFFFHYGAHRQGGTPQCQSHLYASLSNRPRRRQITLFSGQSTVRSSPSPNWTWKEIAEVTHPSRSLEEMLSPGTVPTPPLSSHQVGAELLSVSSDDDNKVFGVTFAPPPELSRGVPHILEHSGPSVDRASTKPRTFRYS
jgi:hypothetical protein